MVTACYNMYTINNKTRDQDGLPRWYDRLRRVQNAKSVTHLNATLYINFPSYLYTSTELAVSLSCIFNTANFPL